MEVLLCTDEDAFKAHKTGFGHPERPERVGALVAGVVASEAEVRSISPRGATKDELARVHDPHFIDLIERFCAGGGGDLDVDTVAGPASWRAALLAAGSGLTAIDALDAGDADVAVCIVRPPGHHARSDQAMGFCLFNNAAIAAAHLSAQGERVAIVDWDVHHGNGTQEMFEHAADVLYVSIHEWGPQPDSPLSFYPGTGWLDEVGTGTGRGATVNIPVPAGTGGDAYDRAFTELVVPALAEFDPDWLIISAGFDAHTADPLAHIRLAGSDYAAMASHLRPFGPTIVFSEGGYQLAALTSSMAATVNGLIGEGRAALDGEATARSPDAAYRQIEQATAMAYRSGALA